MWCFYRDTTRACFSRTHCCSCATASACNPHAPAAQSWNCCCIFIHERIAAWLIHDLNPSDTELSLLCTHIRMSLRSSEPLAGLPFPHWHTDWSEPQMLRPLLLTMHSSILGCTADVDKGCGHVQTGAWQGSAGSVHGCAAASGQPRGV